MQSNQTSSHQIGFFAARGLCAANQVKPRATFFCPASLAQCYTSAKSLMPFAIAQGHQFYLLSPEAFLLTVFSTRNILYLIKSKERWAVRARGREPGLAGWQRSS
jgi:hypothetical protein